jgi:hypothetical protein
MPPTVAAVISYTFDRAAGRIAAVNAMAAAFPGLVPVSTARDQTNADLMGCVVRALGFVGLHPASPFVAADADLLALMPGRATTRFLLACYAEVFRLLLDRIPFAVDEQVGNNSQRLSQLSKPLWDLLAEVEAQIAKGLPQEMAVGQPPIPVPFPRSPIPNDLLDPIWIGTDVTRYPYP